MTIQNLGPPDPKVLVIVDEATGEEIGRCGGFTWDNVAEENGTPRAGATFEYAHKTKIGKVRGPVKKIGLATNWTGTMSEAAQQRIKQLEAQLQSEYETSKERLEEIVRLEQRLVSILRMLGGAVTITDFETSEAGNFIIEEAWTPTNGTILTLVERA